MWSDGSFEGITPVQFLVNNQRGGGVIPKDERLDPLTFAVWVRSAPSLDVLLRFGDPRSVGKGLSWMLQMEAEIALLDPAGWTEVERWRAQWYDDVVRAGARVILDWLAGPGRGRQALLADPKHDIMQDIASDYPLVLGIQYSGYGWGYALNAARRLRGLEQCANPALVEMDDATYERFLDAVRSQGQEE